MHLRLLFTPQNGHPFLEFIGVGHSCKHPSVHVNTGHSHHLGMLQPCVKLYGECWFPGAYSPSIASAWKFLYGCHCFASSGWVYGIDSWMQNFLFGLEQNGHPVGFALHRLYIDAGHSCGHPSVQVTFRHSHHVGFTDPRVKLYGHFWLPGAYSPSIASAWGFLYGCHCTATSKFVSIIDFFAILSLKKLGLKFMFSFLMLLKLVGGNSGRPGKQP